MNAVAKQDNTQLQRMDEPPRGALTPYDMLSQAVAGGAGMEVIEKLMSLQERWEANQARKAFDAAMSDAKTEITPIVKNRAVGYDGKGGSRTSYRHEDLAEIARTVDPLLAKHGLSYRFQTTQQDGFIHVTCIVSHRDGHSERNVLFASADASGSKNSIQALGSTITYLQRYTLKAALGLAASNDDDGRASEQTKEEAKTLTPEQVKAIEDKINETDASTTRLLKQAGVARLEEIPTSDFADIMRMLSERGAQRSDQHA
jgi:hypothetical protein